MKKLVPFVLVAFLFSAWPRKMDAQSDLNDLKKKEAERRKNAGKSKISVNDNNVQRAGGGAKSGGYVQVQTSGSTGETASEEKKSTGGPGDTQNEEYWRNLKTQLEAKVSEQEAIVKQKDAEINKLWTDFYLQNDPVVLANIKAQITRATNEREAAAQNLRAAKGELDALPERARKAGVPPGWIR